MYLQTVCHGSVPSAGHVIYRACGVEQELKEMPAEMCGASPGAQQLSFVVGGNSAGGLRETNLRQCSPSRVGLGHCKIAEGKSL